MSAARRLSPRAAKGPAFYRASFELKQTGDTYLNTTGWGKGYVWVNGHNLGRYWRIGPQQALYVPAEWLNKGRNDVVVLDLDPTGSRSMKASQTRSGPTSSLEDFERKGHSSFLTVGVSPYIIEWLYNQAVICRIWERETMKNTGTLKVAVSGDTDIVLTRVFDAPRHLVYQAMTQPQILSAGLGHAVLRCRSARWTCALGAPGAS